MTLFSASEESGLVQVQGVDVAGCFSKAETTFCGKDRLLGPRIKDKDSRTWVTVLKKPRKRINNKSNMALFSFLLLL